jgi:hypothetical protein
MFCGSDAVSAQIGDGAQTAIDNGAWLLAAKTELPNARRPRAHRRAQLMA